jgi:hypothetical protein
MQRSFKKHARCRYKLVALFRKRAELRRWVVTRRFATYAGDVTTTGAAATIAANAVTNSKAAQMAAHTIKGRDQSGHGDRPLGDPELHQYERGGTKGVQVGSSLMVQGTHVYVINEDLSNTSPCYPASSVVIDNQAANVAVLIPPNTCQQFLVKTTTALRTVQ